MRRKGNFFEQKFFTEALSRGYEVFVPLGDYLPQDCLILNSAGKVFKIQIKGTQSKRIKENKYAISTSFDQQSTRVPIDCTKVDVLVAYIEDKDVFYLFPCLELDGAKVINLYPHRPDSKAKHEKYLDNWAIFKTAWII